jgi:hypothetical protein
MQVPRNSLVVLIALSAARALAAEEVQTLDEVLVTVPPEIGLGSLDLSPAEIALQRARTSDTASLLLGLPRGEHLRCRGRVQSAGNPWSGRRSPPHEGRRHGPGRHLP